MPPCFEAVWGTLNTFGKKQELQMVMMLFCTPEGNNFSRILIEYLLNPDYALDFVI